MWVDYWKIEERIDVTRIIQSLLKENEMAINHENKSIFLGADRASLVTMNDFSLLLAIYYRNLWPSIDSVMKWKRIEKHV